MTKAGSNEGFLSVFLKLTELDCKVSPLTCPSRQTHKHCRTLGNFHVLRLSCLAEIDSFENFLNVMLPLLRLRYRYIQFVTQELYLLVPL